eukprot:500657-Rhodomonas_salina.3
MAVPNTAQYANPIAVPNILCHAALRYRFRKPASLVQKCTENANVLCLISGSAALLSTAHRTAPHCTALHCTGQDRTALHGTAHHTTPEHSTTQHSTTRHSTGRDGTAQQNRADCSNETRDSTQASLRLLSRHPTSASRSPSSIAPSPPRRCSLSQRASSSDNLQIAPVFFRTVPICTLSSSSDPPDADSLPPAPERPHTVCVSGWKRSAAGRSDVERRWRRGVQRELETDRLETRGTGELETVCEAAGKSVQREAGKRAQREAENGGRERCAKRAWKRCAERSRKRCAEREAGESVPGAGKRASAARASSSAVRSTVAVSW